MCCGETEADVKAREAMSDDRPSVTIPSGEYVALYAKLAGSGYQIGNYGLATTDIPCYVPAEEVAAINAEGLFRLSGESLHVQPSGEMVREFHAQGGKVWHDNPACTIGNNVESENLRDGRGGLKRCPECRKLARKGEE